MMRSRRQPSFAYSSTNARAISPIPSYPGGQSTSTARASHGSLASAALWNSAISAPRLHDVAVEVSLHEAVLGARRHAARARHPHALAVAATRLRLRDSDERLLRHCVDRVVVRLAAEHERRRDL